MKNHCHYLAQQKKLPTPSNKRFQQDRSPAEQTIGEGIEGKIGISKGHKMEQQTKKVILCRPPTFNPLRDAEGSIQKEGD